MSLSKYFNYKVLTDDVVLCLAVTTSLWHVSSVTS